MGTVRSVLLQGNVLDLMHAPHGLNTFPVFSPSPVASVLRDDGREKQKA